MKKCFLFLFIFFSLVSFDETIINECIIKGSVSGINDNDFIYLKENDGHNQLITLDSTIIKNGKFEFKIKASQPTLCILIHKDINGIPLIVEKGTVSIEITKYSENINSKISGTYNNDEMQKVVTLSKMFTEKLKDFQNKNMDSFQKAVEQKDETTSKKLMQEYEILQKEYKNSFINYAESNPKSFVSILLLESSILTPDFNFEKISKIYNAISIENKNTKQGIKVKELLENIKKQNLELDKLSINAIAPDFSAKSPEGSTISLKESLGKVTIIDFWASWCAPCRRENPSVVALYKEFHSKGLNIVGVSLDQDINKWKEAIIKDKITWTQVSNIKGWEDPIAILYHVESIPQTYILDSSGKIIAKDLRGEQLKSKIKELLGVK